MPRKPVLDKSELENSFLSYKTSIINDEGNINPPSNKVWLDISTFLESAYTPKYLYVYVKQNRGDIWKKLGIQQEILEKPTSDVCSNRTSKKIDEGNSCDLSKCSEFSETSSNEETSAMKFSLTLSSDEWNFIKPTCIQYQSVNHPPSRNYNVLEPKTWTPIINEHFWDVCSIPCCLTFKRANIRKDSPPFIKLNGKCSSCHSKFQAVMPSEPPEGKRAVFNCSYTGNFRSCKTIAKRRLIGNLKNRAQFQVCDKGVSPTLYRNLEARSIMQCGDSEPAHLPSSNALRIMKCRNKKKDFLNDNSIVAINLMMHSPKYQGAIRALGYEPFYAFYWMPSQLHV